MSLLRKTIDFQSSEYTGLLSWANLYSCLQHGETEKLLKISHGQAWYHTHAIRTLCVINQYWV